MKSLDKLDFKEVLDTYNEGILTRNEAHGMMVPLANVENLSWLRTEHPKWYKRVFEHADRFPAEDDEEGWGNTIEIGSWCGSEEAAKAWRAGEAARTVKFRAGVQTLREFHAAND